MTDFFENEKNVREYIASREDFDGRFLIEKLKKYLPNNSTVLELGTGSGYDLEILNETFQATGSDNSKAFVKINKQNNPATKVILLDAETILTNQKFDCIFSNKVLHHISRKALVNSIENQKLTLKPKGLIFHTFWNGKGENEFHGLHFIKYEIEELKTLFSEDFKILEIDYYQELIANDSIYIIGKLK